MNTPSSVALSADVISRASLAMQTVFKSDEVKTLILSNAGSTKFTDKVDGSPVTEIDVRVEKIIKERLESQFPDIPVFGEETGYDVTRLPKHCWLVDPIDGTKNFITGSVGYTNMAALIDNGETVAGIIYNPLTDEMYCAEAGQGTYKISDSAVQRISYSDIALPHVGICKGQLIQTLDRISSPHEVFYQTSNEGGGYGFTQLLDGKIAARVQILAGGNVHDYAPGALLVREAGGVLIPVRENEYTFTSKSFIAAHPDLADIFVEHIETLRRLEK